MQSAVTEIDQLLRVPDGPTGTCVGLASVTIIGGSDERHFLNANPVALSPNGRLLAVGGPRDLRVYGFSKCGWWQHGPLPEVRRGTN
jgi:hypothetical protein